MQYFKDYLPKRFVNYIKNGGSNEKLDEHLFHTDRFEFHYIQYLSGKTKTLRRVFYETRFFPYPEYLPEIIEDIEKLIIENEYYELMEKHKIAKKKILKLI